MCPWPPDTWASRSQDRMGPQASWPLEAGQLKGRLRPWGLLSKAKAGWGEDQVSRLLDLSTTSPDSSEISNGKAIPRWGKKRVIFSVLAPYEHLGRGGSPTDTVRKSWVMSRGGAVNEDVLAALTSWVGLLCEISHRDLSGRGTASPAGCHRPGAGSPAEGMGVAGWLGWAGPRVVARSHGTLLLLSRWTWRLRSQSWSRPAEACPWLATHWPCALSQAAWPSPPSVSSSVKSQSSRSGCLARSKCSVNANMCSILLLGSLSL